MAKAHANIGDISNFLETVRQQSAELQSTLDNMRSASEETLIEIEEAIQKAEQSLEECEQKLRELESQRQQLESQLCALESQLASTPPTIEESYTDENGDTHTTTVPNPAYAALQSAIAAVADQISQVQSMIGTLQGLRQQILSQKATLESAKIEVQQCISDLQSRKQAIEDLSSVAGAKLQNILQVLQEYTAANIGTPTLSRRAAAGFGAGGGAATNGQAQNGGDSLIGLRRAAALAAVGLTAVSGVVDVRADAAEVLARKAAAERSKTQISRVDATAGSNHADQLAQDIAAAAGGGYHVTIEFPTNDSTTEVLELSTNELSPEEEDVLRKRALADALSFMADQLAEFADPKRNKSKKEIEEDIRRATEIDAYQKAKRGNKS